jgi:hypothetical protein
MNAAAGKLDQFLSSNAWAAFSDLSPPGVGSREMERAMKLIRLVRSLKCSADVRITLTSQPHCVCSFSVPDARDTDSLIGELNDVVEAGLILFYQELGKHKDADAATKGIDLKTGERFPALSALQVKAIRKLLENLSPAASPVKWRRSESRSPESLDPDDIRQIENELNKLGPA